ncbi:hypothetical protein BHE74_00013031 [Ensete ventricosum]|nr:hypothetical protein BHE74_00013031 [Ensete ventricosum]
MEHHEINQPSENDRARAQLLDALRHSQTRARKAEMAAQKAYDEKEHIVKLLFREASHLFAYKQWLLMLQLENLCLQLKIKDHQLSTLVPVLPWMPLKEKLFSKDKITRRQVMKKQNCELESFELQEVLGKGIQALRLCEEMISKLGLLSSNETKVDVNAANLKSLLIAHFKHQRGAEAKLQEIKEEKERYQRSLRGAARSSPVEAGEEDVLDDDGEEEREV